MRRVSNHHQRLSGILRPSATIAMLMVAPGFAQETVLGPGTAASAQEQPASAVPVSPAASDERIATRIASILSATGWYELIDVEAREGIVFLDGTADTQEQRRWAGSLAESTEGVVAVVNRIEESGDLAGTFERAGAEVSELGRRAVTAMPLVLLAIFIIAVAWIASWLVHVTARHLLRARIRAPLLLGVVSRAISIPVLLLGVYFVLRLAGLTQLALTVLGGTGLAGIIIGFAFRDIAENFLASMLLSMRNPFRNGDLIEVAGHAGVVQNLNTRSTVLLTMDGNHVQIPNATVFKSTIKNYSSIPYRRAEFLVGIGYDSSAATAQGLIAEVLGSHPAVLDDPEPLVLVDELGEATVNLRVFYWFDSATYSPAKTNSALLRQTKNVLLKAGIELPDPAREVVFPRGVPIIDAKAAQGRLPDAAEQVSRSVHEDDNAVAAEGDLSSDTIGISRGRTATVPEASVNLLRDNE